MDGETVETVTGWESEPLSGGIDGLRTLQSRDFTGAVTEGHAWLFMLNGRVVGVFDGSLDSFADADGTAYVAPDPSLPLLYAMRERGGETKARYYTNDTALSAADAKLSSGKFTGYIELSENVLSGDYYAVYYGGRRLACAFVGTGEQKQVLTGDEAFEAADDEVGIYEVVDVDVDVVDIPDPEPEPEPDSGTDSDPAPDSAAASATAAAADPDAAASGDSPADGDDRSEADSSTSITFGGAGGSGGDGEPDDAGEPTDAREPTEADESPSTVATAGDDDPAPDASPTADATATTDAEVPDDPESTDDDGEAAAASPSDDGGPRPSGDPREGAPDPSRPSNASSRGDGAATRRESAGSDRSAASWPANRPPEGDRDDRETGDRGKPEGSGSDGDPFSAEEQWRETRSIPSLDPSRTATPAAEDAGTNGSAAAAERRRRRDRSAGETQSATDDAGRREAAGADADGRRSSDRDDGSGARVEGPADASEELAAAREALATARAERDRAIEGAREAREQLESTEEELDGLREENERLSERVEELEAELAEAREELEAARERAAVGDGDDGDAPARTVPADRALAGTNLFVRYDSKGGATLEKAHAGGASRSDVNDNLRLELHTDFEAADAAVDGRPFREFLTDTIEYGFVEWAVRELLYEIQSTGNESALRDLFDAIPEIDRAELDGTVAVDDADGGATEHTFDVVLRDRMGNPLLVADVTEGRDATTESMLDGLVGDAGAVADADDHLAAGFYVTASFFEPGALEAAADATGGGLLSRGKRKSFVKLSRKQGFHLCLVESREGEFHVNVPEL
ncbi:DUF7527 domain-containing protein [Halobaculum roseum]|uniref:DUF7527 domain-containing protein n=1 Tax=Halobaculum roseum TaxID=2175149 RepID=A0ABD5MND9_9EURY|nr:hypothetical protein [Halobaculum roseum]QZY03659.1 hypothetical protein K6T36_05705 [Halobaculum roseum]